THVAADPTIRAGTLPVGERRDRLVLTKRTHLVVDYGEHARELRDPVASGTRMVCDVPAPVADQDGVVLLPHHLEAEVVVHASVREHDPVGIWRRADARVRAAPEITLQR